MLILPIAAQDEPENPSRRGGRGGTRLFQNFFETYKITDRMFNYYKNSQKK